MIDSKLQYMVHCYFAAAILDEDLLMDTAAKNVQIAMLIDNEEVLFIHELHQYSQCIFNRVVSTGLSERLSELGELLHDIKQFCGELAECFWDIVVRDSTPGGSDTFWFNRVSGMPDFDEFELDVNRVIA